MAETDKTEKILDIKVNYSDAATQIARYKNLVDSLKNTQKELKKELEEAIKVEKEVEEQRKAGLATEERLKEVRQARANAERKYTEAMVEAKVEQKNYNSVISDTVKEMRNQQKQQQEAEGSLNALRAELSLLTKEYDGLSAAERQSASGKELQEKINTTTEVLKANEEATGRYFRNVGNYENAILDAFNKLSPELDKAREKYLALLQSEGAQSEATKQAKKEMEGLKGTIGQLDNVQKDLNKNVANFVAGGNPMVAKVIAMATSVGGLTNALTLAKAAVIALGKQLLALLANPIVAVFAGIAAAVMAVAKAIKSSEELTNRWEVAIAPLNVVLDYLMNVLTGVAGAILYVVEEGGKLMNWVMEAAEKLPILGDKIKEVNDATKERIDIQKEQIRYEQMARGEIVASAERENKIAELRAKASDKETYSAQERKQALEEAMAIELEESEAKKKLAELALSNLEREAALTENDAEMNNKLAEAKAAVIRADTEYQQSIRSMNRERARLSSEIASEEKASADKAKKAAADRAKARKDAAQKELEEVRKAEDELLKLVTDNQERLRVQTERNYGRQIADLKKRLEEEKNLTAKAREAINTQLSALEVQKNRELSQLTDEALKERIAKQQQLIQTQLYAVEKGSEEELAKKRELLALERDAELAETELTEEMKAAIREKWAAQDEELIKENEEYKAQQRKEAYEKQLEEMQIRHETELELLAENEMAVLEAEIEHKKEELDTMQQMEGESIDAFNLRKLKKENEYQASQKKLADKEIAMNKAKAAAIASTFGTIANALDELGNKNKKALIASKALALAEVAIQQGIAIANAVRAATQGSKSVWEAIAAIALGVATVVTNMVTAIKSIKSANAEGDDSAQGYATGGLVTGKGTGTSDSIPARLSNGESVMTARATEMFAPMLSAFNTMGGGVPISVTETGNQAMGEEMLARAVARGVQSMPAPVVSVEEIKRVEDRVNVLETLGTL